MTDLLTGFDDGVLRLTLNRPDALNAITIGLLAELGVALDRAARDPAVRVVVIGGAGRAFSAGQDLRELIDRQVTSYGDHFARYIPILLQLRRLEKPVVAVLNGIAAGGGLGLALACDFRLASTDAKLNAAFSRIGLVPDSGLSYILPRLIGPAAAFELLTLSPTLTADEALRRGLVNRVWPSDQLEREVSAFVGTLAVGPTKAYGLTKRALDGIWNVSYEAALAREGELQDAAGYTTDHREGLAAFLEKRPAQFRGA